MERASVAKDGESPTARDGEKWPLEWEPPAPTEQLRNLFNFLLAASFQAKDI
jgi:hypothetical protein